MTWESVQTAGSTSLLPKSTVRLSDIRHNCRPVGTALGNEDREVGVAGEVSLRVDREEGGDDEEAANERAGEEGQEVFADGLCAADLERHETDGPGDEERAPGRAVVDVRPAEHEADRMEPETGEILAEEREDGHDRTAEEHGASTPWRRGRRDRVRVEPVVGRTRKGFAV